MGAGAPGKLLQPGSAVLQLCTVKDLGRRFSDSVLGVDIIGSLHQPVRPGLPLFFFQKPGIQFPEHPGFLLSAPQFSCHLLHSPLGAFCMQRNFLHLSGLGKELFHLVHQVGGGEHISASV